MSREKRPARAPKAASTARERGLYMTTPPQANSTRATLCPPWCRSPSPSATDRTVSAGRPASRSRRRSGRSSRRWRASRAQAADQRSRTSAACRTRTGYSARNRAWWSGSASRPAKEANRSSGVPPRSRPSTRATFTSRTRVGPSTMSSRSRGSVSRSAPARPGGASSPRRRTSAASARRIAGAIKGRKTGPDGGGVGASGTSAASVVSAVSVAPVAWVASVVQEGRGTRAASDSGDSSSRRSSVPGSVPSVRTFSAKRSSSRKAASRRQAARRSRPRPDGSPGGGPSPVSRSRRRSARTQAGGSSSGEGRPGPALWGAWVLWGMAFLPVRRVVSAVRRCRPSVGFGPTSASALASALRSARGRAAVVLRRPVVRPSPAGAGGRRVAVVRTVACGTPGDGCPRRVRSRPRQGARNGCSWQPDGTVTRDRQAVTCNRSRTARTWS